MLSGRPMNDSDLKNWLHTELFERVPTNIAIIDKDFTIVEANQHFADTFGEWRGRRCYEVYKGRENRCESCVAAMTFADGKTRVNDEQGVDRHGKPSYYVVHVEPIQRDRGEIPFVIEMSHDVTESRKLQHEYDFFFNRVPCLVAVLDRDMNIVRNNELFKKTFGESVGRKCYEIYKNQNEPCPDCPARLTLKDGQIHTYQQTGMDKNGRKIHYIVTTAPLGREEKQPSHVIEMALDITQTRALEEQLKWNFDYQEKMIEAAIDGIIAADSEGSVIIFNPSAEKLFKYDAGEVIGSRAFDRFVPREFIDVIARGGSSCVLAETSVQDRDGELIPVRFSGVVLTSDERYLGSAGFFHDLRERKQLEQDKLEAERLAAVGQTVAGLAHGIKNVLMGLEGGMYVVNSGLKKDDTELTRKGWNMLEKNIGRISSYVKDFLSFAKGRTPVVKTTDPNQIAGEVVELYKDAAANSCVELVAVLDEQVRPANLDAEGIHTCLTNLVSNAIDACEMSDRDICRVEVRTMESGDSLVFEVSDNGCGLDYDVKQKVFTTFFSTKKTQKGTGLGLLITKKITQEHGGRVTFESTYGEGSVFRLEFPRDRLPEATEDYDQQDSGDQSS